MINYIIGGSHTFNMGEYVMVKTGPRIYSLLEKGIEVQLVGAAELGADHFAWSTSRWWSLPYKEFPPKWDLYDERCMRINLREMIEYCEYGICDVYTDGKSAYAQDLIDLAKEHDIEINVHLFNAGTKVKQKELEYWRSKLKSLCNKKI